MKQQSLQLQIKLDEVDFYFYRLYYRLKGPEVQIKQIKKRVSIGTVCASCFRPLALSTIFKKFPTKVKMLY